MQLRNLLKKTIPITVLTGLVALFPALLIYFVPNLSTYRSLPAVIVIENVATLPVQEQVIVGLPVHLKIPKINVDSPVEYVGLDSDGAMEVPKDRKNVAWFELGPHPGENGSAVVAGHYGLENKEGSAFDNLHKLRQGDKLYIEDDKGMVISFVVQGNRRYDPKADASGVFSSSDGKSHLNLVTCEGEWDELTQQYSKRLVVFTDREE